MRAHIARLAALCVVLLGLAACADLAVPPGLGLPGSATEATVRVGDTDYLTLAEWSTLADQRLLYPLMLGYSALDQWRPLARASVERRVTIVVGPLDGPGGEYRPDRRQIAIDAGILAEPIDVQVAILAHEIYHSVFTVAGEAPYVCVTDEANAMSWEALGYSRIIRPPGSPDTAWTRTEDVRQADWQAHRLAADVLLNPAYERECLGGEVR